MSMQFSHIRLVNFGMHKELEADLHSITNIRGCNATGKSTIRRAIYWVLNLRDENGKEITGIRPHDASGVDNDNLVTEVELTLDNSITLKKCYYMKHNKKGEATGNTTDCYIADIPKQSGEYAAYVAEIIPNELCVNAQSFLRLDTTKRRALLEETFGQRTTDEIVDMYPEFEPIRNMLQVGTIAELKRKTNVAISGDKNHKGLKQQLDDVPTRIDEALKRKVEINVSELEMQKQEFDKQLEANHAKQDELQKQNSTFDDLSNKLFKIKFEINDLQRQANEANDNERKNLNSQVLANESEIIDLEAVITANRRNMSNVESEIKSLNEQLEAARNEYRTAVERKFDKNSLICPYCKQELPSEQKDDLKAKFESEKQAEIKRITDKGNSINERIKNLKESLETYKDAISKADSDRDMAMINNHEITIELEHLPNFVDISSREDVKTLKAELADIEKQLKATDSYTEMRQELLTEEDGIKAGLTRINTQMLMLENNRAVDERVKELEVERKDLAQQIADQERILDFLERFDRKKQELLTADVNGYFEYVQVLMFEPQLNGSYKDVCQLVHNGERYDRNLNHGARLLTEIDICRAFQKKLGVSIPVTVDDTESLDTWRLPKVDNQLITIARSDDKELMIN